MDFSYNQMKKVSSVFSSLQVQDKNDSTISEECLLKIEKEMEEFVSFLNFSSSSYSSSSEPEILHAPVSSAPSSPRISNVSQSPIARYKCGTAYISKRETEKLSILQSTFDLKKLDETIEETGEDSFLIAPISETSCIIGIGDGVGGWCRVKNPSGDFINPRIAATFVMSESKKMFLSNPSLSPIEVARDVREKFHLSESYGASTYTTIKMSITPDNFLIESFHMGDSIFTIFDKEGEIYYQELEQKYPGNAPFQLSRCPPGINCRSSLIEEGHKSELSMCPNGIIILASDGLWDNLSMGRIQELVRKYLQTSSEEVSELAVSLVDEARQVFIKPDDITCIVIQTEFFK